MVERSTRPSERTIKRLFARSSSRCAFFRSTIGIIRGETVLGEAFHIRAVGLDGSRYDRHQTRPDAAGRRT